MKDARLHPIIAAAATGELPDWAAVRSRRRAHLAAVAELLGRWADELGLGPRDRQRWMAAGWLHDALRDADAEQLAADAGAYPVRVRHGPAAAARLAAAGVDDRELLEAIRYHTLGRRGWGVLGRFLYLADYLEPGRAFDPVERASLVLRLPHQHAEVLRRVCALRIEYQLEHGVPVHRETMEFWNELVEGDGGPGGGGTRGGGGGEGGGGGG